MVAALHDVVAYSTQILVVILVAAGAAFVCELPAPRARVVFWRAVLALCFIVPAVALLRPPASPSSVQATVVAPSSSTLPSVHDTVSTTADTAVTVHTVHPSVERSRVSLAGITLAGLAAGAVARLAWIGFGLVSLRRLRRAGISASLSDELQSTVSRVASFADIRICDAVQQPVTFGIRKPVVLLPSCFTTLDASTQQAVLLHELFHVQQRDWASLLAEEIVGSVFWFHPAVRWTLGQLQLGREQLVDASAAASVGRRIYAEALLLFAGEATPIPAIGLSGHRQLRLRIRALTRTSELSRPRLLIHMLLLTLATCGTAVVVVSALPWQMTLRPATVTDRSRPVDGQTTTASVGRRDEKARATVTPFTSVQPAAVVATPREQLPDANDPAAIGELARAGEVYRAAPEYEGIASITGSSGKTIITMDATLRPMASSPRLEFRNVQMKPESGDTSNQSFVAPADHLQFDRLPADVASARSLGTQRIVVRGKPVSCAVIETRARGNRDRVRYWIDPATHLIWKMEVAPGERTQDMAVNWTLTFESWTAQAGAATVAQEEQRAPLGVLENGRYRHLLTGITFDIPQRWTLIGTGPSSDGGEMAQFVDTVTGSSIAIWMKPNTPPPAGILAQLRGAIPEKIGQRQGFQGYRVRPETIQFGTISGVRSLTAIADFTQSGQLMNECLTWINSSTERAFIFARIPSSQLATFEPQFRDIVDSAIVP
ncbi:MAG TPA: M56 family metallopeptidase [Vicinamibacterales bacterium]|jgi:beta-lactamase regulating signal transducer with metallopeptidase domain